eukprot:923763-Pyramimonas_sp.AAC.1
MTINFTQGKSALLVHPRGAGARAVKADLFPVADPAYVTHYDDEIFLQRSHKYLGTMLAQSGSIAPELAHRRTQQKTGPGPLRRTILKAK